jgi:TfoX N-terminal domain
MAYDEELADRIRRVVRDEPGLTEKRMFGGLAFLVGGHLAASASGQGGMLLRCDPAETDSWVEEPGVSRFVMRGREMDGWLHVSPDVVADHESLERWLAVGVAYARSLPPK